MKKISVSQIKNHITQILRDKIFSGSIPNGEKLTQDYIAESLGVSRMPVREAFQLLEQEGFLERLPSRHMIVNGISAEGIYNNFRVLLSIEEEIVLLLIKYNRDITPLKDSLEQYKIVALRGERQSIINSQVDVHMQLSKMLEDKYIEKLHRNLLEGYFTHALRNINYDSKVAMKNLEAILGVIENKEEKVIRNKLNAYYKSIIQPITEELAYE